MTRRTRTTIAVIAVTLALASPLVAMGPAAASNRIGIISNN